MAARKLGQILVDLGYLTEDQLWDVLENQKQSPGEVIGMVAVRMGLVTEAQPDGFFLQGRAALVQGCRLCSSPPAQGGVLVPAAGQR